MTDKELKKVVTGFTKGILGKSSNVSQCYVVCAPLYTFLQMLNVQCVLVECTLENGEDTYHHWIILLKDGRIIDPTASQFNNSIGKAMPDIYIGEMPAYYNLLTKENNTHY